MVYLQVWLFWFFLIHETLSEVKVTPSVFLHLNILGHWKWLGNNHAKWSAWKINKILWNECHLFEWVAHGILLIEQHMGPKGTASMEGSTKIRHWAGFRHSQGSHSVTSHSPWTGTKSISWVLSILIPLQSAIFFSPKYQHHVKSLILLILPHVLSFGAYSFPNLGLLAIQILIPSGFPIWFLIPNYWLFLLTQVQSYHRQCECFCLTKDKLVSLLKKIIIINMQDII